MDIFFNECSLHGQFVDIPSFVRSLDSMMTMRNCAQKYGTEVYCDSRSTDLQVTAIDTLPQVVNMIPKDKRMAFLSWRTKTGLYWKEGERHPENEYLMCRSQLVTDTTVGECAYRILLNKNAHLISLRPSDWSDSPLPVRRHRTDEEYDEVGLPNHTEVATLEKALKESIPPVGSWSEFAKRTRQRYPDLRFSEDAFTPLRGTPFKPVIVKDFFDLLDVLAQYKREHLPSGLTNHGRSLRARYFVGTTWYSDSSDTEKRDFYKQMTFPHPDKPEEYIFAPFHGKVQTDQNRIHFSWPISHAQPLYILYLGPKITKR